MRALEALTKLVVGMSRLGDYLLRQKVGGIVAATLAFACGAGLVYALRRGPAAETEAAPPASTPACAHAAPPAPYAAVPTYEVEEEEFGTPELQGWKRRHAGTALSLDYEAGAPEWRLSEAKVVVLPSGRTLAAVAGTLYMLDGSKRVVWQHEVSWAVFDFAHVEATGLVYATGGDNVMVILDAATGRRLYGNGRQGRGAYGAVIPYGEDVCLVMDSFGGYREGYSGGPAPMQDGVTAWRGTRMLWHLDVPPDAELQVVGTKIYAVTRTTDRILLKELRVPRGTR
jgi:hypothetical protein